MATEYTDTDLSLVVDSIKKASDRELRVLSEISNKLDSHVLNGTVIDGGTTSQAPVKKQKRIPNNRARTRTKASDRPGEVTAQLVKKPVINDGDSSPQSSTESEVMRPSSSPSSIADSANDKPAAVEPETKKPSPIIIEQGKAANSNGKASESPPVSVNVEQAEIDTSGIEKVVKSGFDAFDSYWKDEKGRLRRANGTYASKEERSQYQKTAEEIAKERQDEKHSSVITKMIGAVKSIANREESITGNDATDAAGAAAGGSWFYATKELYHLGENIFKSVDSTIDKAGEFKNKWTTAKSFSLREFFSNDKQTAEAFTQPGSAAHSVSGTVAAIEKPSDTQSSVKEFHQKDTHNASTANTTSQDKTAERAKSVSRTDARHAVERSSERTEKQSESKSVRESQSTTVTEKTPFIQKFGESILKAQLGQTLGGHASSVIFGKSDQGKALIPGELSREPGKQMLVDGNGATSAKSVPQSATPGKVESRSQSTSVSESKTDKSNTVTTSTSTALSTNSDKRTDKSSSSRSALETVVKSKVGSTLGGIAATVLLGKSKEGTDSKVMQGKSQPESLLSKTKQASVQSEQAEILKEQSVEQKKSNEQIIDLLDEISTNSRSGGSEGGLLSSASSLSDMFGGRERRGRRGRRGNRGRRGGRGRIGKMGAAGHPARSVSVGKPVPKAGGVKSVLSATGKKAAGVASTGMSMAGSAFRGVSTLAKGAGKLVPFLAPMLAAYDAYSGFTDTEKQKEVFNLKEGQEATTGQKMSMAAGSVLDLGGLVSGGAGFLGDTLGALGFDKAKEALTFDSGDIAKSIYSFFGGGSDKSSSAEKTAQTSSASNKVEQNTTSTQKEIVKGVDNAPISSIQNANSSNQSVTGSVSSNVGGSASSNVGTAASLSVAGAGSVSSNAANSASSNYAAHTTVKPSVVDNMQVAKITPISAGATSSGDQTSHYASSPSSLQKTNHVNKVNINRSASSIMAEQEQRRFNQKTGPEVVRLDKKSVDDIAKGVKQANADLTTTIVESKASPGRGDVYAISPQSGGIPNNFEDRSLQRQSADLE